MGEDTRQGGETVGSDPRSPEEIEADIERTRRDLGDTVAAVAEKADVKARVKAKVGGAKPESAGDGAGNAGAFASEHRRELVIGGAVLVAFLLGRRSRSDA